MLGCIPVAWHSSLNPLYHHLPVVVIQDPRVLTSSALSQWDRHLRLDRTEEFHWDKLFAFHWLGLIEKDRRLGAT